MYFLSMLCLGHFGQFHMKELSNFVFLHLFIYKNNINYKCLKSIACPFQLLYMCHYECFRLNHTKYDVLKTYEILFKGIDF